MSGGQAVLSDASCESFRSTIEMLDSIEKWCDATIKD